MSQALCGTILFGFPPEKLRLPSARLQLCNLSNCSEMKLKINKPEKSTPSWGSQNA